MLKLLLKLFLILLIASATSCSSTLADNKDPRLAPITASALTKAIQSTPIPSPKHLTLISRAAYSGLAPLAYSQYRLLCSRYPANSYANLYCAVSADTYWWYGTNPLLDNTVPIGSPLSQTLIITAHQLFRKSLELRPNDPSAMKAYGYFEFYRAEEMSDGLALLKKAERLTPNDPQVHSMFGDIYSNLTVKMYNPQVAEKELRRALALDPNYAAPHRILAGLYTDQKKGTNAQRELNAYLALAPSGASAKKLAKFMKMQIAHGETKRPLEDGVERLHRTSPQPSSSD